MTDSSPLPDVPALVGRSRTGDREAFSMLVERFQDVVYNMIHQRLGDPHLALDAAQETFVNAFLGLSSFRGDASFKTWLLTIALREAENQRRKRNRQLPARPLTDGMDPRDGSESPLHAAAAGDRVALVREALAEADEDDARLILLKDMEDMTYVEISGALGIPVGTVKSGLSRARTRLHAKIIERSGRADLESHKDEKDRSEKAGAVPGRVH